MNKKEMMDKLDSAYSWLKEFGQDSIGPVALLWFLDFRAVQQGIDIAKAFTKGGFSASRKVASEAITRIVLLAMITAGFGLLTYWLGETFVGNFFLTMFSIFLVGTQLYIASIALAAAAAWQMLHKDGKKSLNDMWDLTKHVLYWDCIFILINLAFQPWLPGRFEWFVALFLSEAAWFLLGVKTRKAVRFASATVAGITGVIAFVALLYIAGTSVEAIKEPTEKLGAVGIKAEETCLIGLKKVTDWGHNRIETISVLPASSRIVDANQDGQVDSTDADVIESYARFYQVDTSRVMWVSIKEYKYPIGDHDGDGVLEIEDADDLRRHLAGQGPGPADLKIRQGFTFRSSPTSAGKEEPTKAKNINLTRRQIAQEPKEKQQPETYTFKIPADSEQGVLIPDKFVGKRVTVTVFGKVNIGRGQVGPEGHGNGAWDDTMDSYRYADGAYAMHHIGGCEIIQDGQVANGHIIGGQRELVGRSWQGVITSSTRLRVIESRHGYSDNNSGFFTAEVEVVS